MSKLCPGYIYANANQTKKAAFCIYLCCSQSNLRIGYIQVNVDQTRLARSIHLRVGQIELCPRKLQVNLYKYQRKPWNIVTLLPPTRIQFVYQS